MFDLSGMTKENWVYFLQRVITTPPRDWARLRTIMRAYQRALAKNPQHEPDDVHLINEADPMFPLRRRAWILACYAHKNPDKWLEMLSGIMERRAEVYAGEVTARAEAKERRKEYMRKYMREYSRERYGFMPRKPAEPRTPEAIRQSRAEYMRDYRRRMQWQAKGILLTPDEAVQQVTPEDIERHNALARAKAKE